MPFKLDPATHEPIFWPSGYGLR